MRRLVERIDARLNPIMVKEAHQGFRNRGLVVIGALSLGVPLVALLTALLSELALVKETLGSAFFGTLAAFLGLVSWIVVPLQVSQQFHGEVKTRTIDLTLLTALSPWELAAGRLQAVALQLALLMALVGPFAVASVSLGGIGPGTVVPTLAFLYVGGLLQSSVGLLAVTASTATPRLGPLLLIGLAGQTISAIALGGALLSRALTRSGPGELLWALLLLVLLMIFFVRVSADLLAPAALRTYAYSKLIMLVLLASYLTPFWLGAALGWTPLTDSRHIEALLPALFLVCVCGALFSAADDRPHVKNRLGYLFSDVREANVLFVCALLLLLAAGTFLLQGPAWLVLAFLVYFVFYAGIVSLLHSWFYGRGPEGFLIILLVCCVATLVTSLVFMALHELDVPGAPLPWKAVFLPTVWPRTPAQVFHPACALLVACGAAGLILARRRRRALAAHG